MVIIGIDPGTATTGFAVIKTQALREHKNEKLEVLDFGCIITHIHHTPERRLKIIHNEVNKLIKKHHPDVMSIESLYFFKNLKTAIPVSQARGVILLSAAKSNIPVYEFTPLQVKMTVVGYGKADKRQVQKMTKELLDLSKFNLKEKDRKKDDATDALGVAFCATLHDRLMINQR